MSANEQLEQLKIRLNMYETQYKLDQIPLLNLAHEKTKLPRIYIALGGAFIVALLVVAILGMSFVSNVFAFLPIYASYKAIRSPQKDDDEFWLTYWVLFGTIALIEPLLIALFADWMFFIYVFKIVFLLWAAYGKGAIIVYRVVIQPLFSKLDRESTSDDAETGVRVPGGAQM